ncbi:MAG: cytochrome c [Leptospiraceae bacterium]|nr:cytochrome c [Leptospiraceae bacterium]
MTQKRTKHSNKNTVLLHAALSLTGLVAVFALQSCNYSSNTSGAHWMLGMHDSHAIEAQEEDFTTLNIDSADMSASHGMDLVPSWTGPGTGLRTPPAGSIPRGKQPYPYAAGDFDAAAQGLRNPLPATDAILERGKRQYDIYCSVCHGYTGDGKGAASPRFANILPINGGTVAAWEDGRIFHMMTMGRGRMKPFAAQIDVNDRWAIIHYMRLLQKNQSK